MKQRDVYKHNPEHETSLPNSWYWARLGDVAKYINGRAFKPSEWGNVGSPIIRIQNLTNPKAEPHYFSGDVDERYYVSNGDLLISWSATLDVFIWNRGKAILNQHIFKVEPNSDVIRKEYLYFAVKTFLQKLKDQIHGTGMQHITRGPFENTEIPLPSLRTQDFIIEKLNTQLAQVSTAHAALERIPPLLKAFRQSVLAAAFRGELTERDPSDEPVEELLERIRAERRRKWEENLRVKGKDPAIFTYEEPAAPDTSNLPELPEGWVWTTTNMLFYFITSGSRGWAKYYSNTGSIFIRMGNLDHDTIFLDLKEIQYVNPPPGIEGLRTKVQQNDVLISITADVGMIGLVPENLGKAYINQHVSLARPLTSINPQYIAWFLTSPYASKQFLDLQRGATKVGLGLDDITSVVIPLPSLEEQNRIVKKIEFMNNQAFSISSAVETASHQLEILEQAALSKAFRGEF